MRSVARRGGGADPFWLISPFEGRRQIAKSSAAMRGRAGEIDETLPTASVRAVLTLTSFHRRHEETGAHAPGGD